MLINQLFDNPMPEKLHQYVDRIMREEGLSSYDVERRSGNKISQTQVNRIQTGRSKNPHSSTLDALAKGLGRSPSEVSAVARDDHEDDRVIAHDRLLVIDTAYPKLSKQAKIQADYLIDLLAREILRLRDGAG